MISFVGLLTVGGLVYMSWKLCDCSCCCLCLKDLEKKDVNQIYGDYYYSDGERRAGDMEVFLRNPSKSWPNILNQVEDSNPEYSSSSIYMESKMDTMAKDNNPEYGYNWDIVATFNIIWD